MSWYSVIRYVPDLTTEESIVIGVCVWDESDTHVMCEFLPSWDRVCMFVGGDESEWLEIVAASLKSSPPLVRAILWMARDRTVLLPAGGTDINAIVSPPRGSTLLKDDLLTESVKRFLTVDPKVTDAFEAHRLLKMWAAATDAFEAHPDTLSSQPSIASQILFDRVVYTENAMRVHAGMETIHARLERAFPGLARGVTLTDL